MCSTMAEFEKRVYEDEKNLAERLCLFVISVAKKAVDRSGVFTVGLSGGYCQLSRTISDENSTLTVDFPLNNEQRE